MLQTRLNKLHDVSHILYFVTEQAGYAVVLAIFYITVLSYTQR